MKTLWFVIFGMVCVGRRVLDGGMACVRSAGGVAIDPGSGKLSVVDSGNHRVLRFANGANATSLGEACPFTGEGAVALLPDYFGGCPPSGLALVSISDKWATWEFLLLRQRGKASTAVKCLVEAILKGRALPAGKRKS